MDVRFATACLVVLALAGCEGASEAEHVPEAEADWETQVRAVAAGQSAEIRVESSEVTDADLERLADVAGLKYLNIGRGRITGDGLERVASVPGLRLLRVVGADELDDAALVHLAGMDDLRYLMLYDVPITDEGLRHLHSLERLESFYFSGTHITDAGIRELTQALPDLHVHW